MDNSIYAIIQTWDYYVYLQIYKTYDVPITTKIYLLIYICAILTDTTFLTYNF